MTQEDISFVQGIPKISWHTTYEEIISRLFQDKFLQTTYSIARLMQRLQSSL